MTPGSFVRLLDAARYPAPVGQIRRVAETMALIEWPAGKADICTWVNLDNLAPVECWGSMLYVAEDEEDKVFSFVDFFFNNQEGLAEEDLLAVERLLVGETYGGGGGAWASWAVRRVQ